jgi:predicted DNA-binding transcriptional regulator AlpA
MIFAFFYLENVMKEQNEDYNNKEVPKYLKQREVAQILSVSTKWCERMRWVGGGPPFKKIGGAVRYEYSELLKYLNSLPTRGDTGQGGKA